MRYMILFSAGLFSFTLSAAEVTGLNTFQAGEKALASEVNDNFTAVSTAVADNDARITANTSAIQTNSSAVANKMTKNVGTCAPGTAIREIKTDGAVTCETTSAITEGAGISVTQPVPGTVTVSVADGGISSSMMANDSVGSSEIIADSVQSASHIKDEAGITSSQRPCNYPIIIGGCSTLIKTTDVEVASVTINAPGPGFVFVTFSGKYNINHSSTAKDAIFMEINERSTPSVCNTTFKTQQCNGSYRFIDVDAALPDASFSGVIQSQIQFTVSGAGNFTYYADAKSSKDSGITIGEYSMSVMYFPTSY